MNLLKLRFAFKCLSLCCSIFCKLIYTEMHNKITDRLDEWVTLLLQFISTRFQSELDGVADQLRADVCDTLQLLMTKHEAAIMGRVHEFIQPVMNLFERSLDLPSNLSVAALRFLCTTATSGLAVLYSDDDTRRSIRDTVIASCLMLKEDDRILFQQRWKYIKRDSDKDDGPSSQLDQEPLLIATVLRFFNEFSHTVLKDYMLSLLPVMVIGIAGSIGENATSCLVTTLAQLWKDTENLEFDRQLFEALEAVIGQRVQYGTLPLGLTFSRNFIL
ncbi:hypothetical protein PR202_gb27219 [Eleusine coracana subsp. coracana]|uniref:Exportin-2 central domain-containing protein n=1 Tax=Eleusine coracana subsp. coracana TaxID=191504 RepID=A0AAV5FR87_ELECO|nr:hypothetical protein PR202_gb27219 [Eleusine coracana subsp. coracana]